MSISKTYSPREVEDKWYAYWLEQDFFSSKPDNREPYTIVIPPPNVTGVLHMGHMLNNTIQDVLIRRARMMGKNACWVPGTDHASIATEAKVVALLKEKGISKNDLSREEFLGYAFDWKEKYGGIILEQLKKLGASCDWNRTRFTMEDSMSRAVIKVFIDMHKKGWIYRGVRMVNWDPAGMTAISDEEVIRKEVNSKLYYIKYRIVGANTQSEILNQDYLVIATTRPETIMADAAICVNPNDERYKHLKGKKAIIPLINREIPIIGDDYVTMDFGTGCLKVTPAHDLNDYELGIKHKLPVIDILNDNGTLNEKAEILIGKDRFAARKEIGVMLENFNSLQKIEDYKSQVGFSERTDAVIEPKLSMQWFLKMDKMAAPALNYVMSGEVKLIPDKFKNTYKHWMENVHDWCISRQLWWGQQIPAWYLPDGTYAVAETRDEAWQILKNSENSTSNYSLEDLNQDSDVVDTWFSSWLWPISVFDGFEDPENEDINYYYPTNDLVTAPEILFFWVARMIMAGHEYRGKAPFKNVYLTGIVRDKQGRKMSKSLGNSPDPLDLITEFGADGVRVGMLLCSSAGNDVLYDNAFVEQGRNFSNKIWNAFRLLNSWTVDKNLGSQNELAVNWFESKFNAELELINQNFDQYRISEAMMLAYKLVWDDFCSTYLEMIKPGFEQPIDAYSYNKSIIFFDKILKLLHPFMPFITEELWHQTAERKEKECCIVAEYPKPEVVNRQTLDYTALALKVISEIRNIRNQKQISPKEKLALVIPSILQNQYASYVEMISKLANLSEIKFGKDKPEKSISFMVGTDEFYIPMENMQIDTEAEKERILKEIEYFKGFLKSVDIKLNNEKFVSNAKIEVIEIERKKKADAESKIKQLIQAMEML